MSMTGRATRRSPIHADSSPSRCRAARAIDEVVALTGDAQQTCVDKSRGRLPTLTTAAGASSY